MGKGKIQQEVLFKVGVEQDCKTCKKKVHRCSDLIFKSKSLKLKIDKKCDDKIISIELPCKKSEILAQYHNTGTVGSPAILPGQPLSFLVPDITNSEIIANTGIYFPFTSIGTVFNIKKKGTYRVEFSTIYGDDAAVVLYVGTSIPSLAPLLYTTTGKSSLEVVPVSNSFLIRMPSKNSYIALAASLGNANTITIPANSSANNVSITSISIQRVSK